MCSSNNCWISPMATASFTALFLAVLVPTALSYPVSLYLQLPETFVDQSKDSLALLDDGANSFQTIPKKRAFDRLDASMFDFGTNMKRFDDSWGAGGNVLGYVGRPYESGPSYLSSDDEFYPIFQKRAFDRLEDSGFFGLHKRSQPLNKEHISLAEVSNFLNKHGSSASNKLQ